MSEADTISNTSWPRTRQSIAIDLINAGLNPGMTVIVHSSLSSLGWVCGGPVAVVQALIDTITPTGTLVMPTHSGDYSDPEPWEAPAVPKEWYQTIRDTMPAFDPQLTPSRGMGRIVEVFRTWENVVRSTHPKVSFAALGKHTETVIKNHSLDYSLGEKSPLARLYDLDASVLLLGVGYDSCTCFHLSEYRSGKAKLNKFGAPILEKGKRIWKTYKDIEFDTDHFVEMGEAFERTSNVRISKVGSAQTKFFAMKDAVNFGVNWLIKKN